MKTVKLFFLSLILITSYVYGYEGRVLTVEPLIIIMDDPGSVKISKGSEVTVTYKAGFLPMDVGRFRVSSYISGAAELDPIAVNTAPEKGMHVEMDVVRKSASHPQSSTGIISGKVTKVDSRNDNVWIEIPSPLKINNGSRVDLYYKTSGGDKMEFGRWKVSQVDGKMVVAKPVDMASSPMVGLDAIITVEELKKPEKKIVIEEKKVLKKEPGIYMADPFKELDNIGKEKKETLLGVPFPEGSRK